MALLLQVARVAGPLVVGWVVAQIGSDAGVLNVLKVYVGQPPFTDVALPVSTVVSRLSLELGSFICQALFAHLA